MAEFGITQKSKPIRHHNGVFDRVIVTFSVRGGSLISYWLDADRFEVDGPYTFYLEWAEHPDADWLEVAGPTSGGTLTDSEVRVWSKLPHTAYRVRVNTADGDFYSDPVIPMGNLNRHDFLLARDIIRREYLMLTRYTGTKGLYLARKQWGELCPECTDYNTGMVTNSHCDTCYGTGFVGGYHTPSFHYMGEERVSVRSQREDGIGVRADQSQRARSVACPFLTAKDVWVNLDSDQRWSIEAKQETAALRGHPLVWDVELRLIEPGNIAYDLPVAATSSSSS